MRIDPATGETFGEPERIWSGPAGAKAPEAWPGYSPECGLTGSGAGPSPWRAKTLRSTSAWK